MKVKELRQALRGVDDNATVVFQANVPGEEDRGGAATYTAAVGTVFEAFARHPPAVVKRGAEFVIDGKVTSSEGGVL